MTETVFEKAKQNLISRFNQAYLDDYGREKGEQSLGIIELQKEDVLGQTNFRNRASFGTQ